MAVDEVSIYNMALNSVGTRDNVSSPSETSREAEVCRLWYGPTRDQILRAAPWPCAKAHERLALLATRNESVDWSSTDPDPGFRFAYKAPTDMLAPRYTTTYGQFALSVYNDASGSKLAIMSNEENLILSYTRQMPMIGLWDIALRMAIVHGLAAYICMPLTAKAQRAKKAEDTANNLIFQARELSANDDNVFLDTVPEWFTARGYGGNAPAVRFYYPFGPAISFSDASLAS